MTTVADDHDFAYALTSCCNGPWFGTLAEAASLALFYEDGGNEPHMWESVDRLLPDGSWEPLDDGEVEALIEEERTRRAEAAAAAPPPTPKPWSVWLWGPSGWQLWSRCYTEADAHAAAAEIPAPVRAAVTENEAPPPEE